MAETGKTALITGVTGQDGAYLAEFLLTKGYRVYGVKRRSSSFNTARVDHLYHDPHETGAAFDLQYGDVTDATNVIRIVQEGPAGRNLQSRRPIACSGVVRDARIYGQCRRIGNPAPS